MKKHIFSLLLLISTVSVSFSQTVTNTEALQNFAKEKAVKSQNDRDAVNDYAQRYNIPIRTKSNGKVTELMFIDDFGLPQYYVTHNENAAKTISTNKVYSGGGAGLSLSGSGVMVHEWDAGTVLSTHQEFGGRVTIGDVTADDDDHATHVAGTIMAAGVVSAAKGMAFSANLTSYDWSSDESEMASEAAGGALVSNHSYGTARGWNDGTWHGNISISNDEDYLFGFYNSWAADWDEIAYNAPYYLIVKSAGNDRGDNGDGHPQDGGTSGFDCIGPKGVAKNILTVGAINDISNGWSQSSDVGMTTFSSWGPADDGRIKPDIVANGVALYSSLNRSDSDYDSYSGTSMSAPSVTGSAALLIQHYENVNGSGTKMKASTLKALIINTADEAGPNTGPDYMFGWGLMNTESAAAKITENQTSDVILEHYLSNGSSYTRDITTSGTDPLKVTIVWTDPKGIPVANSLDPNDAMLVNDLDLKITQASNTYYPWSLSAAHPANAATNSGENNVDNVETVYIASPADATTYTIAIDHDGTLSGGSQAFSMIISGDIANSVAPVADFYADNTTPAVDTDVQFTDASANIPTSWAWSFSPSTVTYKSTSATSQNPVVEFNAVGSYSVTLIATNATGSDDITKTNYIIPARDINWTGTESADWNTPSNWNSNTVPASGDFVTIPGSLSHYPSVDESNAVCYDLDIENGGQVVVVAVGGGGILAIGNNLTIENGGLFEVNNGAVTVTNELLVGEGTSGTFDLNGGSVTVTKNFNSEMGCTVDISSGSLDIGEDWRRSDAYFAAKGTINLSGGTIVVRDDCAFSSDDVTGSMTGDFQMTVWDDFQNNHNGWSTVTGGTITLTGAYGYPYLFSTNSDHDVIAYNLVLNGPGSTFYLCSSSFNHGIIIKNNLTFTDGTVVTINGSYHTDRFNVAGQFSMGSGAHFKDAVETADSYSVGDFSFDAASIYEYYGSNQTMQYGPTYGNLYISTSTLVDINGSLDIDEDLYIETGGTLILASGANIDVNDDIIINDEGLFKVNDGEVTIHDDLVVGLEYSGEFEQNGGTVTVTGDFSTRVGCTIDINGGTLNILSNWDNNGNIDDAQGNIELSGGTIDLAGSLVFEYTNVAGIMNGTNMSVGGDFNIDGDDWTISAGTISFDGSSTQEIDGKDGETLAFKNVVIESGSSVDIDGATSFGGTFTVESDATNSGSLIVTTAGSVTGNVTYNRYMTADKWHIVSAPVEAQDISDLLTNVSGTNSIALNGSDYGVTDYLEATNEWGTYFTDGTAGNFTSGKGYLMRRQSAAGTVSFTGTVTDAYFGVTLSKTETTGYGWNALGNPFTSAMNANSTADGTNNLLTVNAGVLETSFVALYIWDEQADYTSERNDYKVINHASDDLAQDYIQAGQGFIVKAKTDAATFSFTRAMQTHQTATPFKSAEISEWADINIVVSNSEISTKTRLKFNEQMTNGLDIGYDAGVLKGNPDFSLYTQLIEDNGVEFMLQCLPLQNLEMMEIPVGLDATIGGEITLSIQKENFPGSLIPVLNDKLLNTQFAFNTESDVYATTINDNTKGFGRFTITFSSTTDIDDIMSGQAHFKAWHSNGLLNISGEITGEGLATVYDINGRKLAVRKLMPSGQNQIQIPTPISGIYLIKVEDAKRSEVLKVVKTGR